MDIRTSVVKNFTEAFTGEVAQEVAAKLTCMEIETLADLMIAMGREDLASEWLGAHAAADYEGDAHYARVV